MQRYTEGSLCVFRCTGGGNAEEHYSLNSSSASWTSVQLSMATHTYLIEGHCEEIKNPPTLKLLGTHKQGN